MYLLCCCVFFVFTHMRTTCRMCLCFLIGWMIYCTENNNSNSVELKLLNKPLILSIVILSKMGAHKYFFQLSKWKSCKKSHKIFWDCCLKSPKKKLHLHIHNHVACWITQPKEVLLSRLFTEGKEVGWGGGLERGFFFQSFKSFNTLAFWCSDTRTVSVCKKKLAKWARHVGRHSPTAALLSQTEGNSTSLRSNARQSGIKS